MDALDLIGTIEYTSLNRGVIRIPHILTGMLEDKLGEDYETRLCFVVIHAMGDCDNFEDTTQVCTSNPEFDDEYDELSFWYCTMTEFLKVKQSLVNFLYTELCEDE